MGIQLSNITKIGTNKQVFGGVGLRTCLWGSSTTDTCTNNPTFTYENADAYWASAQALTGSALTLKHNYGHYGYTTAQLYALLPAEYAADPDFEVAILQLAGNDLTGAGVDYNLVRSFITYLLFRGKKIVLILSHAKHPNATPERYIEFREFCNGMIKLSPDSIYFVDFYKAISEAENPPQYLQADLVHLNSQGAFKVGKEFIPVIKKMAGVFDFYPYAIGEQPLLGYLNSVDGFTLVGGGALSVPYEYQSGRKAVNYSITNSANANLFINKSIITGIVSGKKYRAIASVKAITDCPVPGVFIRSGDSSFSRKMRDEDACYFIPKSYATMLAGEIVSFATMPFTANAALETEAVINIAFRNCVGKSFSVAVRYFDIVEVS